MPSSVLVPIDGSEQSYGGLEYALTSFPDATITTLTVVDAGRERQQAGLDVGISRSWEERARSKADRVQNRAREHADRHEIDIRTETSVGIPHREILDHVAGRDVDHVSIGSHGESPITHPFVGHVTEAVVRRAPVPVTVVPETADRIRSRELPGDILAPVDGSEQSRAALEYALAEFPDSTITALHVVELPFEYAEERIAGTYLEEMLDDLRKEAERIVADAEAVASDVGRDVSTAIEYGKPAREIVDGAATRDVDQIVMGGHGRSTLARLLLGSVAETVARRTPVPVTLVRGRPSEP